MLRTESCRNHIERYATATSSSMKNITQETIRSIPISLPLLEDQRRMAARLSEELAEIARARAAVEAQLAALDRLPSALMSELFGTSK
jgi:type I restriction enzyme S subunit